MATYNVRGIRDSFKRRKIYNFLHDQNFDIICLQETHSTPQVEKYWAAEWGGKIFFDHWTSAARGCAILVRKGLTLQIHNIIRDTNGRFIIIKVESTIGSMALANLYAPNDDEPNFFAEAFRQIDRTRSDYSVIMGDFNTVLSNQDIVGGKGNTHTKCTRLLNELMEVHQLIDVWRVRNSSEKRYTWFKTLH